MQNVQSKLLILVFCKDIHFKKKPNDRFVFQMNESEIENVGSASLYVYKEQVSHERQPCMVQQGVQMC